MPLLLEPDAEFLTLNYDALSPENQAKAKEWLGNYKQQQYDKGEPLFPTQEKASIEKKLKLRGMFEAPEKIDYDPGPMSANPALARMQYANMALLSQRYQKEPREVSERYDLLMNDYARQSLGVGEPVDTAKFYALAQKEFQRMKQVEDTSLEGAKAALRGEDVIKSLQAWQAKNLDRIPDSTEFTKGYLNANEAVGDFVPMAKELLGELEAGFFKTKEGERPRQENPDKLRDLTLELAQMKGRDRKQVYAALGAQIEAAGYDQKGFWAQTLGFLGKNVASMGQRLNRQALGLAITTATTPPASINDEFGFGPSSEEAYPQLAEEGRLAVELNDKLGVVESEIARIVSGDLDPVKATTGWMNETVEKGLIMAPGATLPSMAIIGTLGPFAGGAVIAADFAESNRTELIAQGFDPQDAKRIGAIAAPMQAAVESLSNMFQLGRFPAVTAALSRFTRPVGGASLIGRYAQNTLIAGATETAEDLTQEQIIVPIVTAIDQDTQIGFGKIWENIKTQTPELLSVTLPMALVFGGKMTAADAKLSGVMTQDIDGLKSLGYSEAQAITVVSEKTELDRIKKASSLWDSRAGDKVTIETGAKNLAERMRQLSGDAMAQQQELERRGKLPIIRPMADGKWLMSIPTDGSAATFNTHQEADAARWTWAEDQLGKVHALTRETLATMEKNLAVGREVAVEFVPKARFATAEELQSADIQERVQQGKVLGDISADTSFEDAQAIDKATTEADGFLSSLRILGSSKNEFKDGILRTTIKLWEGSNILTLVEEKLEGDAKVILSEDKGRNWMLSRLRRYESESGDKLFAVETDDKVTDKMIVEAWSHLGQSYLVGRSTFGEPLQKKAMRRFGRLLMRSGLTGAINAESSFFAAVASRAQKIGELKQAGKLSDDLVSELEKQLGIDSQVSHDAGAAKEADVIASEAVNTSGYSPENPGPNGDTFSLAKWSKGDKLSNGFLGTSSWSSFRDGIENIDPSAKGGISTRASNAGTKDAELTSLWRSGFTAPPNAKEDARGGEHVIEFRNGRAYKQTHPETFGAKFNPETPNLFVWGTPLEYLQRWRLFNEIFNGADVRFEGVVMHPNGLLSLKISQPIINGEYPSVDNIEDSLGKAGWKNISLNTWEKETSRGKLLMTDAKPANFKVSGGVVVPVDVIVSLTAPIETFSLRSGDFASRMEAKFSLFQAKPELRLAIAQIAKERVLQQSVKINEAIAKQDAATRALQEAETAFAEEMASLRADYEADEKAIRDERDTELKGVAADKGTELDRERIRRDADKKLARVRLEYERNQKEIETKKAANDAKLNKSESAADREALKAIVRALDGALAVVPPIVRASVGGYFQAAKITTSAGMLKWAETRIDKLNVELEKYLKKEYRQQIAKLFKRYAPKKDDKGRITSNITADAAEDIGFAFDFASLDDANQEKEMAALEKTLEESEDSTEIQDAIGKLAIVQLFHKLEERESSELEAAAMWLKEVGGGARETRKIIDAARAEAVKEAKNEAKKDASNGKLSSLPDAENVEADVRSSTFKRFTNDVKGFLNSALFTLGQQLEIVFGQDSRITTEFHRRAVMAANNSTDIKRDIEARRAEFVAKLFGTKSRIQQAGRMGALTVPTASGAIIEAGGKTTTIDVPAEVVLRIIEGTADLKALGFTNKEASTLADAWADNEALPAKRQKRVFKIERRSDGKNTELKMSQDEAIQYLLWSKQKASREQMERDGWSKESFRQLNTFLSDDAKALAGFFADEYARMGRLIEPVYRRMFYAPFPQVTNYSPIFRDISSADSIIDIDQQGHGSGVSSGFILARNKNARSAMRRTSAISAFMQHAESAAHWVSHVELVRDLRSVLIDKEVQNAIRSNGRTAAANGIKKRVMQLENQGKVGAAGIAELDSWGSRLLQARAFKGLAWRISPVLKQTSAYFNPLLADVPAWDYMRGTARLLSGKLDVSAMWKSPDIQRRIAMGFSAEAKIAMDRLGYTGSTLLAAMGKGMMPMALIDAGWTTAGAAVAFDYYRRNNIKSGMNETMAENAALNQLEMMIAESAQPADAVNRSLIEGIQNPWLKSMWMFSSESRKTLAIEIMALRRLATGKSKNKALDAQRAVVAHVVMAATTQLMAGVLSLLMGDDDDREREWSVEEWAAAIAAGPINGLFLFGDAVNYIGRRLFGLYAFEPSTAIGQAVKTVSNAPSNLDKVINGEPEEQRKAFLRLGEAVGQAASLVGPGNPFTATDVILGNPLKDAEKILTRLTD
jgi:hypothetical protein